MGETNIEKCSADTQSPARPLMTEINDSSINTLNDLLEKASDDFYIKDIVRTFETEQTARLSQALFKLYTLTGMLFEKIRRSDTLTLFTQVYKSTPATRDKRVALNHWTLIWINKPFFSAGIGESIRKKVNAKELSEHEADLCSKYYEEKSRIASGYREIGALFTLLMEAINQDSHISSLSIGGGLVLTAAPIKIIEASEKVLLITSKLIGHSLFGKEEYVNDGKDLASSIKECQLALAEFRSSLDAGAIRNLLLKGVRYEEKAPFPEQIVEGEDMLPTSDNQPASSAEIKAHFGNLVMLISKNIMHIQDEVRNSSSQIAEVIDRSTEKSLTLLKSEIGTATSLIATKLEPGPRKADQDEYIYFQAKSPTMLANPTTTTKISQQEAEAHLELLKHEITKMARVQFAPRRKPVEYYHCIVNKTMYEAYLYNRINDIRSKDAAELIDRLITSRNPRHADVVKWQLDMYGDRINRVLSAVVYPLFKEEDADDVPF